MGQEQMEKEEEEDLLGMTELQRDSRLIAWVEAEARARRTARSLNESSL